jgi:hypothetical protein
MIKNIEFGSRAVKCERRLGLDHINRLNEERLTQRTPTTISPPNPIPPTVPNAITVRSFSGVTTAMAPPKHVSIALAMNKIHLLPPFQVLSRRLELTWLLIERFMNGEDEENSAVNPGTV